MEQINYLRQLQMDEQNALDFWTDSWRVGQPIDIHVGGNDFDNLARSLNSAGIKYHVKVDDLGQAIEEERLIIENRNKLTQDQKAFDFENYHPYEEVPINNLVFNYKRKPMCLFRLLRTWNN